MTHWKASNLAYQISRLNTDTDLIIGPVFNGIDWDIACWDISKKRKMEIPGGFLIKSQRVY